MGAPASAAVVNERHAPGGAIEPALAELAQACGVALGYDDYRGGHPVVPRATLVAVLRALGVDPDAPGGASAALARLREARWRRTLPPYVVTRAGTPARFAVHLPHGEPVSVWVELEDGGRRGDVRQLLVWVEPHEIDGALVGEATFELPEDLPPGWHTIRVSAGSAAAEAAAVLIAAPARIELPPGRTWGFATQLYSVRSRASWGLGDLADLAELAAWSGRDLGAGLVLVNPLHAAPPVPPMEPSPYYPSSRRFVNPVYLRVEDVPEADGEAVRAEVTALGADLRAADGAVIDRDAVWAAKRRALQLLYAVPPTPERQAAYAAFREREGTGLDAFATWCALAERHGSRWREWPAELTDPASPAVAAFAAEHSREVDFHRWLQWLCDEQLAAAQRVATDAGMTVGLVNDLAVGVNPDGADAWALHDVLAAGVSLGAPPDAFNQQGQDWRQPPWHPQRLAEAGFAPFRDLVRAGLRHGGGLRIDHVIGLFRQWWLPVGAPPSQGAYVRLDHEALVGIVALEAYRAGGLVVGEDLGVVEPWVRDYLADRGIPGTSVLWFERDGDRPRRPDQWRPLCLATVTTHDLPPTAGYLAGEHLELRRRLGLLDRPYEQERKRDAAERAAVLRLLVELRLLDEQAVSAPDQHVEEVVAALHAFVGRTPARLAAVSLTDVTGDRRTQNLPGTVDEYPNWKVPLSDADGRPVSLEDVRASPRAALLGRLVAGQGPSVTVSSADPSAYPPPENPARGAREKRREP